jgi:hypothetical protein
VTFDKRVIDREDTKPVVKFSGRNTTESGLPVLELFHGGRINSSSKQGGDL